MKSLKLLKAQCIQELLSQTVAYLSQKGMDTSGADTELNTGGANCRRAKRTEKF